MTFEHSSSSLGRQCLMVSAENNTSGPVPQCSKDVDRIANQASDFKSMTSCSQSVQASCSNQMTSDQIRFRTHEFTTHQRTVKFKAGSKSCSSSSQDSYITKKFGITNSSHAYRANAEDNRTVDLPKDNPKFRNNSPYDKSDKNDMGNKVD
ncbi:hypothetical protein Tco_0267318 [Tanacetum coccineum]